jgi:hypothetical protein
MMSLATASATLEEHTRWEDFNQFLDSIECSQSRLGDA